MIVQFISQVTLLYVQIDNYRCSQELEKLEGAPGIHRLRMRSSTGFHGNLETTVIPVRVPRMYTTELWESLRTSVCSTKLCRIPSKDGNYKPLYYYHQFVDNIDWMFILCHS